jgi:hypothetical protein
MNKSVSVALAGALALSAIAVSATGASAGNWPHHNNYPRYQTQHYRPAPSYDPGPAIIAGTFFGLALGALAQPYPAYPAYPPPPPAPTYYYPAYGDPHFQWCAATYGNYDSRTDTWTDYRGVPHRCIEPY